ncbi:MAG: MarR family winged helix-turn-helix transcriptional regulator [Anaerovoracaceae bacterium]|nr:MarR family winged helix-turn-helix transcriptional regulator [Anaerovoracaceae bacterium]
MREHSIFGTTSILYRYSKKYFSRSEDVMRFKECHPPYLLAVADNEGCDQETIANYTHINKGRVAKVLGELETMGYIKRKHPDGDRRRNLIYLTDRGRETVPKLLKFEDDFNAIITKGMDEKQKKEFMSLLNIAAYNALNEMEICAPPALKNVLEKDMADAARAAERRGRGDAE